MMLDPGDPIQETIDIIVKRRTEKLQALDNRERERMSTKSTQLLGGGHAYS